MFEIKNKPDANDPYMINPKGLKVQVPQAKVPQLLKMGFILFDPNWVPKVTESEDVISRTSPLPLEELKGKLLQQADTLEVTEI